MSNISTQKVNVYTTLHHKNVIRIYSLYTVLNNLLKKNQVFQRLKNTEITLLK